MPFGERLTKALSALEAQRNEFDVVLILLADRWSAGFWGGPDEDFDLHDYLRARFEANPADVYAAAAVEPHGRWLQETQHRLGFRAIWQKYFESHDVFLLPAGFSAAFPHDRSQPLEARVVDTPEGGRPYLNTPPWTCFATVAGLPATVAPAGFTDAGLPVGMQIVAPMCEDGTSIEFAALLAAVVGGFVTPPAYRGSRREATSRPGEMAGALPPAQRRGGASHVKR